MMSQQAIPDTIPGLAEHMSRMFRRSAPFMATGSLGFAIAAAVLLGQSGTGVVIFAEGPTGTAIAIPAKAVDPVIIYAVTSRDAPVPDVRCTMATTSDARVGLNLGRSVRNEGRTLQPVGDVSSQWRGGDTLTCASPDFRGTMVLGHDDGLTRLLQGLLCVGAAILGAIFALVGLTIRRHSRRLRASVPQNGHGAP